MLKGSSNSGEGERKDRVRYREERECKNSGKDASEKKENAPTMTPGTMLNMLNWMLRTQTLDVPFPFKHLSNQTPAMPLNMHAENTAPRPKSCVTIASVEVAAAVRFVSEEPESTTSSLEGGSCTRATPAVSSPSASHCWREMTFLSMLTLGLSKEKVRTRRRRL